MIAQLDCYSLFLSSIPSNVIGPGALSQNSSAVRNEWDPQGKGMLKETEILNRQQFRVYGAQQKGVTQYKMFI